MSIADPSHLLNQLQLILESDPLIDEVGFIHPSQFAVLNEEAGSNVPHPNEATIQLNASEANASDMFFWNRDHKLGISTAILFPLYDAAKHAFLAAFKQYKMVNKEEHEDHGVSTPSSFSLNSLENEVMKHSRALVLLSCDYGTAWNCRKQIVSKQQHSAMFMDELHLSTLVLSYSPKSERAWSHRRWVIKMIAGKCSHLQEIVERESDLVKSLAEKSKMNYRAWYHRCWLASYMTRGQVLDEFSKSKDWAGLHVADSSCFHYLAKHLSSAETWTFWLLLTVVYHVSLRLMLRMLEDSRHCEDPDASSGVNLHQVWKEELDWVEMLIKRYIGREALWLHRRFLALCWIKHLAPVGTHASRSSGGLSCDIDMFINKEVEIFEACTIIPDNDFEDYKAQATHAATYIMWLMTQVPQSLRRELQKKIDAGRLKILLKNVRPEKSVIWDSLVALCESI